MPETPDQRFRCQHRNSFSAVTAEPLPIAIRRPDQKRVRPDQTGDPVLLHETAVRQIAERSFKRNLAAPFIHSRRMQDRVHLRSQARLQTGALPCLTKLIEPLPPTLGAGSVTGGESSRFIEKKQLRIEAG